MASDRRVWRNRAPSHDRVLRCGRSTSRLFGAEREPSEGSPCTERLGDAERGGAPDTVSPDRREHEMNAGSVGDVDDRPREDRRCADGDDLRATVATECAPQARRIDRLADEVGDRTRTGAHDNRFTAVRPGDVGDAASLERETCEIRGNDEADAVHIEALERSRIAGKHQIAAGRIAVRAVEEDRGDATGPGERDELGGSANRREAWTVDDDEGALWNRRGTRPRLRLDSGHRFQVRGADAARGESQDRPAGFVRAPGRRSHELVGGHRRRDDDSAALKARASLAAKGRAEQPRSARPSSRSANEIGDFARHVSRLDEAGRKPTRAWSTEVRDTRVRSNERCPVELGIDYGLDGFDRRPIDEARRRRVDELSSCERPVKGCSGRFDGARQIGDRSGDVLHAPRGRRQPRERRARDAEVEGARRHCRTRVS